MTLLKWLEPGRVRSYLSVTFVARVKQTRLCLFIKAKMAAGRCVVWKLIIYLNQTLQKPGKTLLGAPTADLSRVFVRCFNMVRKMQVLFTRRSKWLKGVAKTHTQKNGSLNTTNQ